MTKDGDKLKPPPELEKLKAPRFERLASPEQKSFFEQIGRGRAAEALRDARLRLAPPKPKGYDAPVRNVLCSIMRDLSAGGLNLDDVSTYRLERLIKPLWDDAWCRLYPERKRPNVPGKGTVADARAALKNLPR